MSLRNAQVRATVAVSDIDRAADFYEQVLGLTPLGGGMDAVRIYACAQGSLLQVYASEHAGTATATVASWSAGEFDSVVDELRANGVALESYGEPSTENGVHAFGEHRVVWFRDPDGNTLAVDNGREPS